MGLMDILQQYVDKAGGAPVASSTDHFDEVARSAPPQVLQHGLADAFRSDQTPPFGQMVGQLFGKSNPQQQAGVLNQLLGALGPGVLSGIGGGLLGRMLGSSGVSQPQVTPDQASQLTPEQVQQIAAHAEQQNPGIIDKIGGFYAEHPELVKTLGTAALTIALAGMANRMRS